jgi:two-component system, chemotaxis family, chemotaxis protein CheY
MFDSKTRVLIVDDMMTMRKIVSKKIRDLGFTDLTEAGDGIKAWEAISAASPQIGLVISDWNMPNCSGLDLLKRIRADSRFKTLPFLMVTAEAEMHQIQEALKAGVDSYVIKPFDAQTLSDKLEQVHKKVSK